MADMSDGIASVMSDLILVVDDDPVMRRMARHALARDGLRVAEAADGVQALDMFRQARPHLILLDGMMPVLDGFAACVELRKLPEGASTPVLMVTALDDDASVDRAFDAGATDYITKPVHWGVLRRRVRHLLQASLVEAVQLRMEAVVRHAGDGIITCERNGQITSANAAAERIFGLAAEQLMGRSMRSLIDASDDMACRAGLHTEVNGKRADGTMTPLDLSVNAFNARGEEGLMAIVRDISDRKRAEAALRDSELLHRSIITSMAEGVMITDANGVITTCNASAESILGLPRDQLVGRCAYDSGWNAIDEDGKLFPAQEFPVALALRTGQPQHRRIMGVRQPGGGLVWIIINTQPLLRPDDASPHGVVVSFADITERQELLRELRYSSSHDMLTGLYNRAYFEEEMQRLERGRHFPVSIVMVDIDGMKAVNDRYGHNAGDELLRRAAQILTAGFRADDIVARVGGDEFAIILAATVDTAARAILRRIAKSVVAWNAAHEEAPLSLSMGSATAGVGIPLLDAWKEADRRMYEEKQQRKQASQRL
jgi:diguanylate cyclase (GGDEF)-like protein/PAS domain S-box-containing protein